MWNMFATNIESESFLKCKTKLLYFSSCSGGGEEHEEAAEDDQEQGVGLHQPQEEEGVRDQPGGSHQLPQHRQHTTQVGSIDEDIWDESEDNVDDKTKDDIDHETNNNIEYNPEDDIDYETKDDVDEYLDYGFDISGMRMRT